MRGGEWSIDHMVQIQKEMFLLWTLDSMHRIRVKWDRRMLDTTPQQIYLFLSQIISVLLD